MSEAITVVEPAFEVTTAADARTWCRIDSTVEDTILTKIIKAARERAEFVCERALLRQTLELTIDEFPADGIKLVRTMNDTGAAPEIVSVTYVDQDGVTQTMPTADYYLDDRQTPCWLVPAYDGAWPATRAEANAVVVRYTAGFDEAAIPASLWTYVMAYVASWYRTREIDAEKPLAVTELGQGLLEPFKTYGV